MHVGMSTVFQNPGKRLSDYEVYRNELRLADLAEPLGYESIWGVEHHFTGLHHVPRRAAIPVLHGRANGAGQAGFDGGGCCRGTTRCVLPKSS